MNNTYENFDEQELDFPLLFLYNQPDSDLPQDERADESGVSSSHDMGQASSYIRPIPFPYVEMPRHQQVTYEQLDLRAPGSPSHHALLQGSSPRIEITLPDLHHHDHTLTNPVNIHPPMLTVPGYDVAYRESQCLSPASSTSSTSWHSDACSLGTYSPCLSPGACGGACEVTEANLCPRLLAIQTSGSPRSSVTEDSFLERRCPASPRSRSSSPQGKRTYDEYQQFSQDFQEGPAKHLERFETLSHVGLTKPVPTKIIRPCSENHEAVSPSISEVKEESTESCCFTQSCWSSHLLMGLSSMPVSVHPGLDWPLPSSTDQYQLRIEVQPRQFHRAHYETEGSRGAVKACSDGHPVVQLCGYTGTEPLPMQIFIGTSDNRNLRPHAFYQVHRITGKAVTTSSQERILDATKILEVSLEPNMSMRAVIDCAGILKLRNADIELKKGETDVGRKNTRVKLVFRVHIPQAGGQWVSLQAASDTIECSQRSAGEQPAVERQDVECCSALGGVQMTLRGQNFTSESRVVFFQKSEIGIKTWEAEAQVYKEKTTPHLLYLDVPPYQNFDIFYPVKVNFHVLNSKKKCSQPQHFTYTPHSERKIKEEPVEERQSARVERPDIHLLPSCHYADGYVVSAPCPAVYSSVPQHVFSHYQLHPSVPGPLPHSAGRALSRATQAHGTTSPPQAGASTHQHASLFPIGHVREPLQSPQHQRTISPVRVIIKQESLD